MAKYLIQDIIPPDRRRIAVGEKKHGIKTSPPNSIDHQPHLTHDNAKTGIAHAGSIRIKPKTRHLDDVDSDTPQDRHSSDNRRVVEENPRQIITDSLVVEPNVDSALVTTKYFDESISNSLTFDNAASGSGEYYRAGATNGGSFWKNWTPWFAGTVLTAVGVIVVLNYFGGATVIVSPKKDSVPIDLKLAAFKKPANAELSFSVMKITLEETREVPATGEKTLTAKASGSIVIYNKQTTTQRLIKNTRFQTPNGKIYRINDSVNIPASVTKSGKTTLGSTEVTIYADEAGPDYNSPPTDFTLPGLKGSPTFDKVYARGKGPIAGGASGIMKTVSDSDMKSASDELRVQLETKLRSKARGDLAPSQLSFDKGIVIEMTDATLLKSTASSVDKAIVSLSGTLYMTTFNREELAKAIVEKVVQSYKGETVSIANIESVQLELPLMTGKELWGVEKIDFTAKGTPNLEWSIDESAIKKSLIGIPRQSFNSIMAQFPTIELAKANISPAWKRAFPKEEKDITVQIESLKAEN